MAYLGRPGAPLNETSTWTFHFPANLQVILEALSYRRGAPRPLVNGGLRPLGGVVTVRPKAMSRPRKAAGLLRSPARSPPSSAVGHPDGG
jgi:hypothetical protein